MIIALVLVLLVPAAGGAAAADPGRAARGARRRHAVCRRLSGWSRTSRPLTTSTRSRISMPAGRI